MAHTAAIDNACINLSGKGLLNLLETLLIYSNSAVIHTLVKCAYIYIIRLNA